MIDRRTFLKASAASTAGLMTPAIAQDVVPARIVRFVVPFGPGGPTDVLARIVADAMRGKWPAGTIVENRAGAGSMIGTTFVARSEPDGTTIGVVTSSYMINPAVREKMPFDTSTDLRGLTQLASSYLVLAAHPNFPASDIPGLLKTARSMPDPLAYATPGIATAPHMAAELLQRAGQIKLQHVPYNGATEALTDVLAGRVPLMFDLWHSVRPYVEDKSLKILGVINGQRIPTAPQYPCIGETLPGYEVSSILGLIVPKQTPTEHVEKLATDITTFVKSDEFKKKAEQFGMQPIGSSPKEFDQFIAADIARWKQIATNAGIRL
ncbi:MULTISPECIES: substrate-binding domain-containing protein [unclassified Beijerinckia]|uniref:Bug family tripartite tricarboxylate transporter substrate binding protein n=1 Tax=unclassified Beijerinckia TaxID=2638183 RepID=UPI000896CBE0|nr:MULTISPECIES: substrate-binding domain-containing protein [unclassified Beijerinckia]MDH7794060.1 tripartite-type tricarboxylate transporter receptor subunit TctC [Beijerinckia sp. GAS462]SEB52405.1 Tripartite-type tricarboxylate transporter, receptor component TctC [Beijerinckia sp. 28-YEA-48]